MPVGFVCHIVVSISTNILKRADEGGGRGVVVVSVWHHYSRTLMEKHSVSLFTVGSSFSTSVQRMRTKLWWRAFVPDCKRSNKACMRNTWDAKVNSLFLASIWSHIASKQKCSMWCAIKNDCTGLHCTSSVCHCESNFLSKGNLFGEHGAALTNSWEMKINICCVRCIRISDTHTIHDPDPGSRIQAPGFIQ